MEIDANSIDTRLSKAAPVGLPLAGVEIAIAHPEDARLVPFGVPGEIYVGGRLLCMGYLGDEEKTRAKFSGIPVFFAMMYIYHVIRTHSCFTDTLTV